MNFLKISGLVVGTGSVVGGTGVGIYYATKNKNIKKEEATIKEDQKVQFTGKLVFEKKTETDNYEAKLLNENEYNIEVSKLKDAGEGKKYTDINKIIEISYLLKIQEVKNEIKSIFGNEITLENAKTKITNEETKLTGLFGKTIYDDLKNKFTNLS